MAKKVLAIPGSIRKDSWAIKLANAFKDLAPTGTEVKLADISKLPIFNQDLELPEPDFLLDWKSQIKWADGILIVTPEYNRSIPSVLKNSLDWASRPGGQSVWGNKPAAIAGYSPYSLGAFGANHHLRQVLTFLNMPTLQQPEFYLSFIGEKFDKNNKLVEENTLKHVAGFWSAFVQLMNRY